MNIWKVARPFRKAQSGGETIPEEVNVGQLSEESQQRRQSGTVAKVQKSSGSECKNQAGLSSGVKCEGCVRPLLGVEQDLTSDLGNQMLE